MKYIDKPLSWRSSGNLGCFAIILLSDEGGQNDDPDNITTSRSTVPAPERGRKEAGRVGEQLGGDDFVESGKVNPECTVDYLFATEEQAPAGGEG